MITTQIFFTVFASIAVISAVVMLTRRTALGGAISLIVCFLAFAGLYVMLDAPFVAVMQVMVYAGAIMMLIVFVIMTVDTQAEALRKERATVVGAVIATVIIAVGIAVYEMALHGAAFEIQNARVIGTVANVGLRLFTRHILNFEMLSLLLLVALIGALVLARHDKKKPMKEA
jgi:NADH-quinone oxidoreductase subunit J